MFAVVLLTIKLHTPNNRHNTYNTYIYNNIRVSYAKRSVKLIYNTYTKGKWKLIDVVIVAEANFTL